MKRVISMVALVSLAALACLPARTATAAPILDVLKAQNMLNDVCAAFEFDDSYDPAYTAPDFPLAADTNWKTPMPNVLPGKPPFVDGFSGKGLLVEEGATNLLTPSTSGAEENVADFIAIHGATPSLEATNPVVGEHCIKVNTPGKVIGEGFFVSANSLKVGQAAAASLSLRGSGALCLRLIDMTNYIPAAPLYVQLTPSWQRYHLPPLQAAAAESMDIRLVVTTADATAGDFWADGLQIEPREYVTSWIPGGSSREDARMLYPFTSDAWKLKEGTILLRAQPRWDEWTTLARNRDFLVTVYGEPQLLWNVYNSFGSSPRVKGGNPFDGGWHFFAITWDAQSTTVFHNGQSSAGKQGTAIRKATSFRLSPAGNAVIDQWVILKRALTTEELQGLYAATQPK